MATLRQEVEVAREFAAKIMSAGPVFPATERAQALLRLTTAEANLEYALGGPEAAQAKGGDEKEAAIPTPKRVEPVGPAAKILQALSEVAELDANQIPLKDLMALLSDRHNLNIVVLTEGTNFAPGVPVTIKVRPVPLVQVLELLQDCIPGLVFVVREYGLVATHEGSAVDRQGVRATDFWRRETTKTAQHGDPTGAVAAKAIAALMQPTVIDATEMPLTDLMTYLKDLHHFSAAVQFAEKSNFPPDTPITKDIQGMPLGAALESLEDSIPGLVFVIRDYGLVVTNEGSPVDRQGVRAVEIWRRESAKKEREQAGLLQTYEPSVGVTLPLPVPKQSAPAEGRSLDELEAPAAEEEEE